MHVIATAGHVDHGKSTLVRALTGMEPDRWAEERRRGMTIDLGFAWTDLDGDRLAFVDVPGHQRFIANMLAGLGPAPVVMFVVAADEGWRAQSAEHLAAVHALRVRHGLLVVTRSDLADPHPARAEALAQLGASSLGVVESVVVSATTGAGIDRLREALGRQVRRLPTPVTSGRVRLWIDRAFTVTGSGTVVTATLGAGRLAVGDELELNGARYRIRGLQQTGRAVETASAVSRVAVNLRGLDRADVVRGDAMLTPTAWMRSDVVDVRLDRAGKLPAELMLHFGTAAIAVRTRALSTEFVRLQLSDDVPVTVGDRGILRDPGSRTILGGVEVVDPRPEGFRRRGAARTRAAQLAHGIDAATYLTDKGWVRVADAVALGWDLAGVDGHRVGDWMIADRQWQQWRVELLAAASAQEQSDPLAPGLAGEAARRQIGVPSATVLTAIVGDTDLAMLDGRIVRAGVRPALGRAEARLEHLLARLAEHPFGARERADLDEWGLGPRELAVAVADSRLLRLDGDVFLLPSAPALAMRELAALPQPFTMSEARQALRTTRRVAVPLLEHLDGRGWTERVDGSLRRVRR